MERFEPQLQPQTIPVEAEPQGEDTVAAVEELLKNEGASSAHLEPVRKEASWLMTRLGSSPLARKIYFGAAALSLMAAKGAFSPQEVAAQANKPGIQRETEQPSREQIHEKLNKIMGDYKREQLREKNIREIIEPFEERGRKFRFEASDRVHDVILFGLEKDNIASFKDQREMLIKEIKKLEEKYVSFGVAKEDRFAWKDAKKILAQVDKILAYAQSNLEILINYGELRRQVEVLERMWRMGDAVPSPEDKKFVEENRKKLEEIEKSLRQIILK
ncbi:MAG: hypothetical protein HY001_05410 [Candidatus Portnoybacteria bacterium]|nr:hypothetical protein [Candidatus Portnoybacteria bacterium]